MEADIQNLRRELSRIPVRFPDRTIPPSASSSSGGGGGSGCGCCNSYNCISLSSANYGGCIVCGPNGATSVRSLLWGPNPFSDAGGVSGTTTLYQGSPVCGASSSSSSSSSTAGGVCSWYSCPALLCQPVTSSSSSSSSAACGYYQLVETMTTGTNAFGESIILTQIQIVFVSGTNWIGGSVTVLEGENIDPTCTAQLRAVNTQLTSEIIPVGPLNSKPCIVPATPGGCCDNCFKFSFPGLTVTGSTTLTGYGSQIMNLRFLRPPGTSLQGCFWLTTPSYVGDFSASPSAGGFGPDCSNVTQWKGATLVVGPTGYPAGTVVLLIVFSTTTLTDGLPGCTVDPVGTSRALAQATYTCTNFQCTGGVFAWDPTPYQSPPPTEGCAGTVMWPASITVTADTTCHC